MRRMFSKPQIEAMIKAGATQEIIDALQNDGAIAQALSGKANVYETEDAINDLDSDFVAQLKAGDIVVVSDSGDNTRYAVGYVDDTQKNLYYVDEISLEYIIYNLSDEEWLYAEGQSGQILWSSLTGTKLYNHEIILTTQDEPSNEYPIWIISEQSTPVSSFSQLTNLVTKSLSAYFKTASYMSETKLLILTSYSGGQYTMYYGAFYYIYNATADGGELKTRYFKFQNSPTAPSISDTVTEL